ncbi:MAG: DUF499 domain-containing protein [Bacteroidota bacterium]|nr:DUF499 domain-containing protein [Bacteroidota bacterium]
MAITNYERVGKALTLLKAGLGPIVEREIHAAIKSNKVDFATLRRFTENPQTGDRPLNEWDVAALLKIMMASWRDVFRVILGPAERSFVSELLEHRNNWAHQKQFSGDDALRVLDTTSRLLTSISAPQSADIEKLRLELLRTRFDQQMRSERRKVTSAVGKASPSLKPWRLVATPHDDVASGRYQQAEFAADLWQVHIGAGSLEYLDPVEFFRRTYLTESLKGILSGAVRRMIGQGGDPVVQLQTNFGGGKTHSMLALYHLFSGTGLNELEGIDVILKDLDISVLPHVNRVVLVGNKISPGNPVSKPDGTIVRTLWGELAWQLGGAEAYQLIANDDERATSPGDMLRHLFTDYGPCLILIDEWVAYARQLHDQSDLPAGSFETQFTFAQALTEAAKGVDNCLLVVSLPASDSAISPFQQADDLEVGGQRGREALDRLCNVVGRIESSWRPASADEGFEIVRRRLFQPFTDPDQFKNRDIVARDFVELYRRNSNDFPPECRESDYEKRIRDAYPIHPEVFDRLYNDWSTLVRFQRTRGVLRLMAAVIHNLWEKGDQSPLILPASISIDEHQVLSELTRYLSDNWTPIIGKDIDGPQALPSKIDSEISNLGKYSACRRVARTIYLGSAPTAGSTNRGIEDRNIRLGCVLPGEQHAVFGDALRRLAANSTYLYQDGQNYWYDTRPTVGKLAADRAEQLKRVPDRIQSEIESQLRMALRNKGDFRSIHVAPRAGHDVQDDLETRLVVLSTEHVYHNDGDSKAETHAKEILKSRGASPRQYQNTLVFLAPDQTRLQDLQEATRRYLAWKSIVVESEFLNLSGQQLKQAKQRLESSAEAVTAQVPETYHWLLVPVQSKPADPISWEPMRLRGHGALAERVSQRLQREEYMVASFAGTRLRMQLDNVPLWNGNHVEIRQLVEYFAKYPYLQRLRNPAVLLGSIENGLSLTSWENESFAYDESYDEQTGKYQGLRALESINLSDIYSASLLVKSSVASRQIVYPIDPEPPKPDNGDEGEITPPPLLNKRFYGHVVLNTEEVGHDVRMIVDEVIFHLTSLEDADVSVSLDINAHLPNGAPHDTMRTVQENCRTLGFRIKEFESE